MGSCTDRRRHMLAAEDRTPLARVIKRLTNTDRRMDVKKLTNQESWHRLDPAAHPSGSHRLSRPALCESHDLLGASR